MFVDDSDSIILHIGYYLVLFENSVNDENYLKKQVLAIDYRIQMVYSLKTLFNVEDQKDSKIILEGT